jgi:hypothetical protein
VTAQRRPILALTVHQPWAHLIAHGPKLVENRTWAPNPAELTPGDFLAIHAGKTPARRIRDDAWRGALAHAHARGFLEDVPLLAELDRLPDGDGRFRFAAKRRYLDTAVPYGAIVAVAQVVRFVELPIQLPADQHRWWTGPVGWLLRDVVPIEPVDCSGKEGLWRLGPELLELVRESYALTCRARAGRAAA